MENIKLTIWKMKRIMLEEEYGERNFFADNLLEPPMKSPNFLILIL